MAISIVSKPLRKTDIENRMSFPTKSPKYLPSFRDMVNGGSRRRAVSFQAMDGNGRLWRFACSIRKKGHPKPVLSKGWRAFVAHNKLQIADEVNFYQEVIANPAVNGALRYRIEVKKAVKVFGVVFGYAPMQ